MDKPKSRHPRANIDITKLCGNKRGKYKKPQEFPEEAAHDPLDNEASVYVKGMLAGRSIDSLVTENIGEEHYNGGIEYKLTLMGKEKERLKHLRTQLNFRLNEGKGQATYRIGVEDNGNPLGLNNDHLIGSLETLYKMAKPLNCDMILDKLYQGLKGKIAYVLIQRRLLEKQKLDLRVILLGGYSVGKSTLMGVLVGGQKDDGLGLARCNVARHKHEKFSGETSSINQQIIGFDEQGDITNKSLFGQLDWPEILGASSKILRLIDVSGQEKYSKSMLSAICSQFPDYAVVLISAVEGITETTIQHFHIAFTLKVPVIILVTKTDLINEERLLEVRDQIKVLLKSINSPRLSLVLKSNEDITTATKGFEVNIVPIVLISNKTGTGIDLLKKLLHSLPPHKDWEAMIKDHAEFHITNADVEKDKPPVLFGVVYKGRIKLKQRMQLGPTKEGKFMQVEIQSIRCLKELVQSVQAGQICSFSIKPGSSADSWLRTGGQIRRGMILADSYESYNTTRTFMGEIWTIDGTLKQISTTYQPIINCHNVRQATAIKVMKESSSLEVSPQRLLEITPSKKGVRRMDEEKKFVIKKQVRSNSNPKHLLKERIPKKLEVSSKRTKVLFKFLYQPEYLELRSTFVVADSTLYAFGEITKIFYDV